MILFEVPRHAPVLHTGDFRQVLYYTICLLMWSRDLASAQPCALQPECSLTVRGHLESVAFTCQRQHSRVRCSQDHAQEITLEG